MTVNISRKWAEAGPLNFYHVRLSPTHISRPDSAGLYRSGVATKNLWNLRVEWCLGPPMEQPFNSLRSLSKPSNNVEATLSNATSWTILSTMSNAATTLLPFLAIMLPVSATMSNEISSFRQIFHRWRLSDEQCIQLISRSFYILVMIELCN